MNLQESIRRILKEETIIQPLIYKKTKKICLYENSDEDLQRLMQRKYEDWERGIIKAWGHVLYLGYYNLPKHIDNKVDNFTFRDVFLEYYKHSDEDEDMQDWMSDEPPTMNKGQALFDKQRIETTFSNMAAKTRLKEPLTIYRASEEGHNTDWNSYTTDKDVALGHLDLGFDRSLESYMLPAGYPVIFASGLADKYEVIVKIDKEKFRLK